MGMNGCPKDEVDGEDYLPGCLQKASPFAWGDMMNLLVLHWRVDRNEIQTDFCLRVCWRRHATVIFV